MLKLRLLKREREKESQISKDATERTASGEASLTPFIFYQLKSTFDSYFAEAENCRVNVLIEKHLKALSSIASIQVCGYLIRNITSEAPR